MRDDASDSTSLALLAAAAGGDRGHFFPLKSTPTMLQFDLTDIKLDRLRAKAAENGIPQANTLPVEQLIDQLKSRLSLEQQQPLISTPHMHHAKSSPQSRTAASALIIAIISAVFTGINALSHLSSSSTAIRNLEHTLKTDRENRAQDVLHGWQKTIIYKIVNDATTKTHQSISFDDIRGKYVVEASSIQGIEVAKEDIQPLVLMQSLMELESLGLVYCLADGTYFSQMSLINPRFDRVFVVDAAKLTILHRISKDGGKYTVQELSDELAEPLGLKAAEYSQIIIELRAANHIRIDANHKLWSILSDPMPSP